MRYLVPLFVALALFTACQNNTPAQSPSPASPAAPAPAPAATSAVGETATKDLMNLLGAYYELKDAMVAADTSKANAAAGKVLSYDEVMHTMVKVNPGKPALLTDVEKVMKSTESLISDRQNGIEAKRASFEQVSDGMYALLKDAGMQHAGTYRAFCPMALNDKGAYWLSDNAEIRNPYFGKKMLECGEVRDSL